MGGLGSNGGGPQGTGGALRADVAGAPGGTALCFVCVRGAQAQIMQELSRPAKVGSFCMPEPGTGMPWNSWWRPSSRRDKWLAPEVAFKCLKATRHVVEEHRNGRSLSSKGPSSTLINSTRHIRLWRKQSLECLEPYGNVRLCNLSSRAAYELCSTRRRMRSGTRPEPGGHSPRLRLGAARRWHRDLWRFRAVISRTSFGS